MLYKENVRVLFVDNDVDYLNDCLAEIEKHYIVDIAYNASEGEYLSEVNEYDAIVVDGSLPDKTSYDLCRDVRNASVSAPILVLADRDNTDMRIKLLEYGANVCMYKPVHPSELSLQINALTKLKNNNSQGKFKAGILEVDTTNRIVKIENNPISLRKKEYAILEYLIFNKDKVVSKEELLEHVWEDGLLTKSNTLEVHIRNLRVKIEKPFNTCFIRTIKGFGYKLIASAK